MKYTSNSTIESPGGLGILTMSNFYVAMALLIATTPLAASGQAIQESSGCADNGTEVLVVGQKFSEGPPSYTFRVVNDTQSRVIGVSLGIGARLHGTPHIPTSMGAPMGWKPSHMFGHESPYLHYSWTVETPDAQIQGGQSLSGFTVQLAVWEPDQPRFFLDEPVVQKDLRSIPFYVLLANGACYTGAVRPDGL